MGWLDGYFENKKILENTLDVAGGSGAPTDADYLVATANASLSAERVITDSTSIVKNVATPGQVTFERAALTGDVTASANSNATTIAAAAVVNSKLATMGSNTVKCRNVGTTGTPVDLNIPVSNIFGRGPTGSLGALSVTGGLTISDTALKSKGSFAFNYTFSTTTTETDPGAGVVQFSNATLASVSEIYLDPVTVGTRNIGSYVNTWESGGQLHFISNNSSSTSYAIFDITGAIVDNGPGNFFSIPVTLLVGTAFSNAEDVLVVYVRPGSGLTTADVLAMNVVRINGTGQLIDANDVVISGTYTLDDYTDLALVDPAANADLCVVLRNFGGNSAYYRRIPLVSTGVIWEILGGEALFASNSVPIKYIAPATTFNGTYTLSSANGGLDTLITSADGGDAHGLTAALAVGYKIYVSAGTNTVGFHEVTAIALDSTGTSIQIDLNYNAANTITTIAKAGDDVPAISLTVPPLQANSYIRFNTTTEFAVASTNTKRTKIVYGSTEFSNVNANGATTLTSAFTGGISNQASTSSQRSWFSSGGNGNGTATTATVTGTEVSSGALALKIMLNAAVANDPITLNRWSFWLKY